ncbi:hypothetical protein NPIL_150151 [Nephila pilipes]|uniref:Uncharacterized protein n=1 Tax=Nephila pilipes TaxID=299642 RepID=A0A8X6TK32_NEPPI|nr:hypothetical protein NPIL_150151 [Nephila pilipes]
MKSLATTDISEMVLKTLWMEKLQHHIKHIFVVSDEGIDKLAIMADKINDMHSQTELYETHSPIRACHQITFHYYWKRYLCWNRGLKNCISIANQMREVAM